MKQVFWLLLGVGLSVQTQAQQTQFQWAVPGDQAVIHYELLPAGLVGAEPTPAVTVYANGLVDVSWPWYSNQAGEWQMSIPMSELQASMAQCASTGMLTMNQQDLIAARSNAHAEMLSNGVLAYNSDSSISTITLNITNNAGVILPAAEQVLRFQGAQATAGQLGSETLHSYAAIETWLLSLAHRAAGGVQ